jgi:hypothetical protein
MAKAPFATPTYKRDVGRLIGYYQKAFEQILVTLSTANLSDLGIAQERALLGQIAFILRELEAEQRNWVEQTLKKVFADGQAQAILSMGDAKTLLEAKELVSFSLLSRETVEALVNDTHEDLLMATQNTERHIKRMVRQVVADVNRVKAIQQYGREARRDAIVAELTKKGLSKKLTDEAWTGIVDRAGRRWNLSTYAEMVVRTKATQAHVEGSRVEALERGVDLAVISSHGAKDACRHFEGLVISMNGETEGFLTYDELRRTNLIFHPNCEHKISPIRDIKLLPPQLREKHEQKMREAKKALASKKRK